MLVYCNGKGGICDIPCTNEACEHYTGTGAHCIPTVANKIRSMTDDELVTTIKDLLPKLMEAGYNELYTKICDYQGECETDGNCTGPRHRACILRFLHRPAEEDTE